MDSNSKSVKTLNRLDWGFIIMGLIEIFIFVFITSNLYWSLIGLSIIIPAYIALKDNKKNWNYFVGILAIIKYNPLIWVFLLGFIFGDLDAASEKGIELTNNFLYTITVVFEFCFVLLVISSFIFGIILINKTKIYLKLKNIRISTE